MAIDKKLSDLPVISTVTAADTSILIHNNNDYQFGFTALLDFINSSVNTGATVSFGVSIPQNTTGKNGDLFINTATGTFAQKTSGAWLVKYTLPSADAAKDGTILYGSGTPGTGIGVNNDTYIDTNTGVFYRRASGAWSQVFSMQNGPQGPQGEKGDAGTAGPAGKTVLNGTSNPSNSLTGNDGDFYLNTSTYILFGPKTGGIWGPGTSLIGLQGEVGETGPEGEKGDPGHGIPTGGATGQILGKIDDDDYNTGWVENSFSNLAGQPEDNAALRDALGAKVDKLTGYGLSQENYTTAEKGKLAALSQHFKGNYTTLLGLSTANPTGESGDYAFVDAGIGNEAKMYIWDGDDNVWLLSFGGGSSPDATETLPGMVELATIAEALARTDDQRAMTALKTITLILDEKKKVSYQINPYGLNEVSVLMENGGQVNSILISGATSPKLKIGTAGSYPAGSQTFPFAYAANDRVFITYNYSDLSNASCNIKLKCQDN
ncbi:hypothetical protein [Mucilaginibacter sp. AK015]|uniref:hypothetical protein n=1 Tax=Mucilaginibacter sp. AK015 TaxID=2723072 RepID=UPI0016136DCC|nr:hypothetical protein [Mucilaginibacter sp. AK015]MBB5395636.1 hypothetical protein [Mucilaginibacter sp. AK015]